MTAQAPGFAGPGAGRPNWRRRVLICLVSSLFVVSFIESYASLERAAIEAAIPWPQAWPWQVDGFILATALMVIEARASSRRWGVWWPRLGLFASTGLSTFIQAVYAPDGAWWLHAWSPLAVLFSFECLVWLTFTSYRPDWNIPTPLGKPEPVPEPVPDPEPEPVPEARPRTTQDAPRRERPVVRGRPFTPADHEPVRAMVEQGRTNKAEMARELGLHKRGQLDLGRYVNHLRDQQVQAHRNGTRPEHRTPTQVRQP